MGINETKKQIVIDNYFKNTCDINTSIKEAFTKGFELGLKKAPTPQPKTGHWILTSDDDYEYCTCSKCGYQNGENWMIGSHIKFCEECGAKMVEPQESEG